MNLSIRSRVGSRLLRRAFGVAACLVVASSLFTVSPVKAAEPSLSESQSALLRAPSEAAEVASQEAVAEPVSAEADKKAARTELPERRTEYSRTFDNHDGTFATEVSPAPMHYKPSAESGWEPVDYSFAASEDGKHVSVAHSRTPIEVSTPDDANGFLTVRPNGGTIRLRLAPDAKPGNAGSKPIIDPWTANVHGLLPNVDLRVFPGANGATTFLILRTRPAEPSFTFVLDSPGLDPSLLDDGSIEFLDESGNLVATMPQPYAVDSSVDKARGGGSLTSDVSYALSKKGGRTLLTVSVDPEWLKTATYPVYVDPTINNPSLLNDNTVNAINPSTVYQDIVLTTSPYYHEMWLGTDPTNSANVSYDFIKFVLPEISGTVQSASLEVFPYHQYSDAPTATATWVRRVDADYISSSLTWDNQPSTTAITSADLVEGSWGSFNVTSTVQDWIDSPSTNYGFMLWENGYDETYWKRLISSEDPSGLGPKLVITFAPPVVDNLTPTNAASTNSRALSWIYSSAVGYPQASYAVTLDDDSSFESPILSTGNVPGAATSYSIPAGTTLVTGTTYHWKVQATDTDGSTSAAAVGSFRWDPTAPGAPTNVTGVIGSNRVTVSWLAPASDGGAPITGYTVTSTPQSRTCTTTGALSCTVTGLSNGQSYTFTVKATNAMGTGPASAPSATLIPASVPYAPGNVIATAGNARATVSWTTPWHGGMPITGYTVTSSPEGKTCTTTGALTCVVTGLTGGQAYTFAVTATNLVGTGPAGTSNQVTVLAPAAVPGAPTIVGLVAGNHQVTVSWLAPASDGGAPITGYTVTGSPNNQTCTTTGALSCTVTDLGNGSSYTFTVTATNGAGTGPASAPSAPITPSDVPTAPRNVIATAGYGTATVSWTAPLANGGTGITGYTVIASPGGQGCTTPGALSCTVMGLTPGTSYTFAVTATNLVGTGPAGTSNQVTVLAPAAVPGAPTNVTGVIGSNRVTCPGSRLPQTAALPSPATPLPAPPKAGPAPRPVLCRAP